MKLSSLTILAILFSLISCESPRQTGMRSSSSDGSYYYTYSPSGSSAATSSSSDTTTTTTSTATSSDEIAVSGCEDVKTFSHDLIGTFALCWPNKSNNTLYLKINNAVSDYRVCLIPAYESSSGSIIYLGEPACAYFKSANTIVKFPMSITRTGATMNTVMVMKDKSAYFPYPYSRTMQVPDAYYYCMDKLYTYGTFSYCEAFASVAEYFKQSLEDLTE